MMWPEIKVARAQEHRTDQGTIHCLCSIRPVAGIAIDPGDTSSLLWCNNSSLCVVRRVVPPPPRSHLGLHKQSKIGVCVAPGPSITQGVHNHCVVEISKPGQLLVDLHPYTLTLKYGVWTTTSIHAL